MSSNRSVRNVFVETFDFSYHGVVRDAIVLLQKILIILLSVRLNLFLSTGSDVEPDLVEGSSPVNQESLDKASMLVFGPMPVLSFLAQSSYLFHLVHLLLLHLSGGYDFASLCLLSLNSLAYSFVILCFDSLSCSRFRAHWRDGLIRSCHRYVHSKFH